MEVDPSQTSYIIAFEPNATAETAHHMLLYGCEEPGRMDMVWDCSEMSQPMGTKSDFVKGSVCSKGAQVIYAWASDAPKLVLPPDVGFKIGAQSSIKYLVLQVHYASVWRYTNEGAKDDSGIILTLTDQWMPKSAGVYVLGTNGRILPKSKEHMETACKVSTNVKIHPFAFRTHTHALGKAVSAYVVRRNGFFSHKWNLIGKGDPQQPQMFYPVEDPNMIIGKGDILAARCTMVSNRNRVTQIGPTGDDEMCNFYLMYWVQGDKLPFQKYCFSWGPPFFYWSRYPLFSIPNKEASTL